MKSKILIIYLFAAVLALGVALITRKIMQPPEVVQDIEILTARIDMPMGTKIEDSNMVWQPWSLKSMNDLYITKKDTARLQKLKESIVKIPIIKGEPIFEAKTVFPGDKSLLSAVIKPGMRAYTLQMGRKGNLTALISPGDRVDIVIAAKGNNDKRPNGGMTAQTIVKKVPVIATDGRLTRDDTIKSPEPPEEVTIEVSPQQAENLTAALRDNRPTITVYSLNTIVTTEVDMTQDSQPQDSATDDKTAAMPSPPPSVPLTPPKPEPETHSGRSITLFRGDKSSELNIDTTSTGTTTHTFQGNPSHDKTH